MNSKLIHAGVLGFVFMLSPFAIDMYLPAFPAMADGLATGIDELEATVAIFLFGFALGQLVLGPVSDALGRRTVLVAGLAVFVVASVMIGASTSLGEVYLWRFLQALGGAGSVGVFPMVRDRFGERDGAQVISYIMALTVVAPMIAPLIGAQVLALAGWSPIFFLIGLLGLIALFATVGLLDKGQRVRPDFSVTRMLGVYGAVVSERRILAAVLAGGFAFAGLFAFVAGSPYVYISHYGVAPHAYGFLVALNALSMIGVNLINAQMLRDTDTVAKIRFGATVLLIDGLAMLAIAVFDLGLVPLAVAVVIFVGAIGLTATNAIVAALSVLPRENGTVSAVNGAGQFAVGALSSLIVSVLPSTSALPMTLVMAGCGVLAFASATILKNSQPQEVISHA